VKKFMAMLGSRTQKGGHSCDCPDCTGKDKLGQLYLIAKGQEHEIWEARSHLSRLGFVWQPAKKYWYRFYDLDAARILMNNKHVELDPEGKRQYVLDLMALTPVKLI